MTMKKRFSVDVHYDVVMTVSDIIAEDEETAKTIALNQAMFSRCVDAGEVVNTTAYVTDIIECEEAIDETEFNDSMNELRTAHNKVVKQIADLAVKVGKNQFVGRRLIVSIGKWYYEGHLMEYLVVDEDKQDVFWLADRNLNYYESNDIYDMCLLRNLYDKLDLKSKELHTDEDQSNK